jgi:hypothetical protein
MPSPLPLEGRSLPALTAQAPVAAAQSLASARAWSILTRLTAPAARPIRQIEVAGA